MYQERASKHSGVEMLLTGIPGFDLISMGGLPKSRTTLLSGTSGSAKTVFAAQFLAEGIRKADEPGVFVTFEESVEDLRSNLSGFSWDIEAWEAENKWTFVDGSPQSEARVVEAGHYDLGALVARIENAVRRVGAKRVAVDSLSAIFSQLSNTDLVRSELFRISSALRRMDVTVVLTSERKTEDSEISRFDVEEFVCDNVVVLRNLRDNEKRRRTVEILKFRGSYHLKGEYPFTVMPGEGVIVIPLAGIELKQKSSERRLTSGVPELDSLCGGGFFRDSVGLVSGATGTGKTLLVSHFITAGAANDERTILFAFEESREQLFRNAHGWGMDMARQEEEGKLMVVCEYPEVAALEDHLIKIKETISDFRPTRVAIDSLSALERVSTTKGFREFVIGLTSFLKHQEVACLLTSTTPSLMGSSSPTESQISSITDMIILLRYVEMFGDVRRGLTVLKVRGSAHDKSIREYMIDDTGMHIGRAFRGITGILSGATAYLTPSELDRLEDMFQEGSTAAGV